MRRILHIDMDAFFSSVEQKKNPELAGKPVVIGGDGDPTKRGVVSTASYEARKFGIHSAMPLRTAYKLCPHAIFLPVDYKEYSRVSNQFKGVLREFETVEDVGIDEAFLDISSVDKTSEEIAKEIKRRIKEQTGLNCSIGIAPNKLLAKLASDMEKPDGLTILTETDIERRIWPLPVRKLWGVGPKTEAYLKEKMNIKTIGELAASPLEKLVEEFGESYGNFLYEASRGIDESELVTHWEPKSISKETTFQKDIDNWQMIAKNLVELTKEVIAAMREDGYQGRTVTVKMRFNDFKTYTRARSLEILTDSEAEIRRAAFDCLNRFEINKKVRLIGIRVSNLTKLETNDKKDTASE